MKPHKHAELIKAWADGAVIQCMDVRGKWRDVSPAWDEDLDYRIKPEPKPDVTMVMFASPFVSQYDWHKCDNNIKLIFDGETGDLKAAEMLK